jgi:hypothetical protein
MFSPLPAGKNNFKEAGGKDKIHFISTVIIRPVKQDNNI